MSRIVAVLIVVLLVLMCIIQVFAETESVIDAKKERQKIKEEINSVNKEKTDNQDEVNQYKQGEKKLSDEKAKKDREVNLLTSEILKVDKTLENLNDKIKQAKIDYDTQMGNFKKRLIVMYQNSEMSYIEIFMRSKDLFDFYQKIDIMTKITKKDKILLKNLSFSKKEIEYDKKLQEKLKKDKEKRATEVKMNLSNLLSTQENVKIEINKRMSTIELLEKMEDELDKESLNIEMVIKGMALQGDYTGGVMLWPLPSSNVITSKFGYRIHPIYGTKRFHSGLDIAGNYDSSILAANNGQVIFAGWRGGYGNTVLINHGGKIFTLYGHCSKLLVSAGQTVKVGDIIAKVGSTGASTGNHLHFEVRIDGSPVDPLKYILP
jgi:murein DD-endopeptidase MepM/ murein hydrolase activator NlpD